MAYWGSLFGGTAHCGGKSLEAEVWSSWSHCIQSRSRMRGELAFSGFLFFSLVSGPGPQPWLGATHIQGRPPLFSYTSLESPSRHVQGCISQVSPNPVTLHSVMKCSSWLKFKEGRFKTVPFQRLRRWGPSQSIHLVMREETQEALDHQKYLRREESDTYQWPKVISLQHYYRWEYGLSITKCAFIEPLASLQYILRNKVNQKWCVLSKGWSMMEKRDEINNTEEQTREEMEGPVGRVCRGSHMVMSPLSFTAVVWMALAASWPQPRAD